MSNENPYYGTVKSLNKELMLKVVDGLESHKPAKTQMMFAPGQYMRSDGIPVDETIMSLEDKINEAKESEDFTNALKMSNLLSRIESVSDLTPMLYERFNMNLNSMGNWFPQLKKAADVIPFFKVPDTKIMRLPLELSQFIRHEYMNVNEISKKAFNELLIDFFDLDLDKEYFIKTGVFSSKFEFANAHCDDPAVIGDYFIVINNFAMEVGAGRSNDIVVREWIPDPENRPTIYNGMPLRTEFRAFVNFDTKEVYGVVEYWHPVVMRNVLRRQGARIPKINEYYETYKAFEDTLHSDFNENVGKVTKNISKLINEIEGLTGEWSIDVMKSGDDFYLIDMALMSESALTELLDTTGLVNMNY